GEQPAGDRETRGISEREEERSVMSTAVVGKGLAGVVAANSGICWIDGDAGLLSYRGIDIHELAEKSTFEECSYLLWFGRLPHRAELEDFSKRLAGARP